MNPERVSFEKSDSTPIVKLMKVYPCGEIETFDSFIIIGKSVEK
jgi:hypothetical protein